MYLEKAGNISRTIQSTYNKFLPNKGTDYAGKTCGYWFSPISPNPSVRWIHQPRHRLELFISKEQTTHVCGNKTCAGETYVTLG